LLYIRRINNYLSFKTAGSSLPHVLLHLYKEDASIGPEDGLELEKSQKYLSFA
jgi:hypothetical protein